MYLFYYVGACAIMGFIYKKLYDQQCELYEKYGELLPKPRRRFSDSDSDSDNPMYTGPSLF